MALLLTNPVLGDTQVTFDITGTAGATVFGYSARAGVLEAPTQGASRVGDGSLTLISLINQTAYWVFAQTRISGDDGPASQPLLLTPRATGTSDYDAVVLQLKSLAESATGIGQVHGYLRLVRFWDQYFAKYKNEGKVNAWEITRVGVVQDIDAVQGLAGSEPFYRDAHRFAINGYMSVQDQENTEKTFQELIDDIRLRVRLNNTLNGAVLIPRTIQAPEIGHATLGGVLCHATTLEYDAQIRVGG